MFYLAPFGSHPFPVSTGINRKARIAKHILPTVPRKHGDKPGAGRPKSEPTVRSP